jgi:hypothetical protein
MVLEEADETGFWLELLAGAGLLTLLLITRMMKKANNLGSILVASRRTAKRDDLRS